MSRRRLAIILPVYNPHEDWEDKISHSVRELDRYFLHDDYQIVIVNDGSRDVNIAFQKSHDNVICFSYDVNAGKGHAIRHALAHTDADFYVYTDFDFPFGYASVLDTYHKLKNGQASLVIGTRARSYYKMLPWKRLLISKSLLVVNFFLTGFKIKDTQAGLKGLDNKAKAVFLKTRINGFIFELEFIRDCISAQLVWTQLEVAPDHGIHFSDFGYDTLWREFIDLVKIIFARGQ